MVMGRPASKVLLDTDFAVALPLACGEAGASEGVYDIFLYIKSHK